MLQVKHLSVEFQTDDGILTAVNDVSFEVNAGETLGLVGESGCGKSVSAMSIPRLVPQPPGRITNGEILLDGTDLLKLPIREMHAIRGRDIGVIFQEPMTALSPLHRIGDQLIEVIQLHQKTSSKEARSIALEWLKKVGIPAAETRLDSYPYELSGGMRQRVMIAMAMILHPKLIIADEPTTALDVTIQAQILELMRTIRGDNAALLLITHDMGVIWELCDRMAVMYASRIVEYGPVKEIFAQPRHPYTKGLMQSIPAFSKNTDRLTHIPGQVPSLLHLPQGCAFADRCPFAKDDCRHCLPELTGGDGHFCACHHPLVTENPS
ncbi:MAG: ABC transporter ATP-binding protein [Victivallales bacterium]|nr:ABC transporter ATP-binding protein [Victivallales bacterium]